MAKSFFPNPFLPLNILGSHLPISVDSLHLDEPSNGLKQLKIGGQWGFSQAFSLKMTKVSIPFIQTKASLMITTCLTPWGLKSFLLTKNQSLKTPKTQYKSSQSDSKQKRTKFYP